MPDRRLVINCRWMGKEVTGTERYASEVTRQLLQMPGLDITLLVPAAIEVPEWAKGAKISRSRLDGVLFEQFAIPFRTMFRHVLNMGGPAPILKRNQSVVLYDASVFRFPENFSTGFVAWYKFLYWTLPRVALRIVTISDFSATEISQLVKIPLKDITVATCGSDHADRFVPKHPHLEISGDFVVCVGTLAKRKNLVPIIDKLSESGIRTVVVGASGTSRIFGDEPDTRVPNSNITFAGRLTDDEVAWLFDHALALIFPSLYEGFGLPIVEAQARGCPVIAARSSSIPEVIGSGGTMFCPYEPAQAVEAVLALIENPAMRERLAVEGRRNASRFKWRRTAEIIVSQLP